MILSLDTETTGGDWWHGSRPYLVTIKTDDGRHVFWEWDVDPESREVYVSDSDLQEIETYLPGPNRIVVGQNIKFDVHALNSVYPVGEAWDWDNTRCTLVAAHLLASNEPHGLDELTVQYLGLCINELENVLEDATQSARRYCRSHFPTWAIAKKGREDMPSAKEKTWKIDAWLPRMLARELGHDVPDPSCEHDWGDKWLCNRCRGHRWWVVLSEYANADSAVTLALWQVMDVEIRRRGLEKIYAESMRVPGVLWGIEDRGVTVNVTETEHLLARYSRDSEELGREMTDLAARYAADCSRCGGVAPRGCPVCGGAGSHPYRLQLPKSGNNNSLKRFVFDVLGLPVVHLTNNGNESLDSKNAIPAWLATLPPESDGYKFVQLLAQKRDKDKSVEALHTYKRYWVPCKKYPGYAAIHSSVNQTGTDTLRMSSSNPNSQNVSKDPDDAGISLRSVFGPLPGREWWRVDYENLELRIPAFTCNEEELIRLFESKGPPYYGSEHLLNFSTVYPDFWAEAISKAGIEGAGEYVRKEMGYWYKRCKGGDFAVGYGAVFKDDGSGTADMAFGRPGSHAKLLARFAKKEKLNQEKIRYADTWGQVETIPDTSVDPDRGYPILCSRTEWGRILPTVPLNYWCQSTAVWVARRALVRCAAQLREWREDGLDANIVLYVHDELVFDFPKGGKKNLPRVRKLVKLMEQCGDDIGIPLVAAYEYCPCNWAKSEAVK